jgi:hypothetical protein
MGINRASKHLELAIEQATGLSLALTLAAEQLKGRKRERLLQSAAEVRAAGELSERVLKILRRRAAHKHRYDDADETVEEIFEEGQNLHGVADPSAQEDESPGWQNAVRLLENDD